MGQRTYQEMVGAMEMGRIAKSRCGLPDEQTPGQDSSETFLRPKRRALLITRGPFNQGSQTYCYYTLNAAPKDKENIIQQYLALLYAISNVSSRSHR